MLTSETVDILAHQGGWDELLLFGGPVAVMVLLGYLARRGMARADAEADAEADPETDVNGSGRGGEPLGTSAAAPAALPPAGPAPSQPRDSGLAPPPAGA